jgi:hypothetical protein
MTLASVSNVMKLFCYNFTIIAITSVTVTRKCADGGINYTKKGFITLDPGANVIKLLQ